MSFIFAIKINLKRPTIGCQNKVKEMIEAETLLDEYFGMYCPCCQNWIDPFTIGRVAFCPICRYTWNVTCIMWNVKEKPDLRSFHLDVWRDFLRELEEKRTSG